MNIIIYKGAEEDICFVYRILENLEVKDKNVFNTSSLLRISPLLNSRQWPAMIFIPDSSAREDLQKGEPKALVSMPAIYRAVDKKHKLVNLPGGGGANSHEQQVLDFISSFRKEADSLVEKGEFTKNETTNQRPVEGKYRQRFLIRIADRFQIIQTDQIAYFFTQNRVVYLRTSSGKRVIVDYSMEELESSMDPMAFFRINRSFIVSFKSITEVKLHQSSHRLLLSLEPAFDMEVFVSRERVAGFKKWLGD